VVNLSLTLFDFVRSVRTDNQAFDQNKSWFAHLTTVIGEDLFAIADSDLDAAGVIRVKHPSLGTFLAFGLSGVVHALFNGRVDVHTRGGGRVDEVIRDASGATRGTRKDSAVLRPSRIRRAFVIFSEIVIRAIVAVSRIQIIFYTPFNFLHRDTIVVIITDEVALMTQVADREAIITALLTWVVSLAVLSHVQHALAILNKVPFMTTVTLISISIVLLTTTDSVGYTLPI
jgi:hypothetical protein